VCGTAETSLGAKTGSAISPRTSSPRSTLPSQPPNACRWSGYRPTFPLPRLGAVMRNILGELLEGRGFILLRGLPVERMTREEQAIAYLGLGRRRGPLVAQDRESRRRELPRELDDRIQRGTGAAP
jgi:hypothetical protein